MHAYIHFHEFCGAACWERAFLCDSVQFAQDLACQLHHALDTTSPLATSVYMLMSLTATAPLPLPSRTPPLENSCYNYRQRPETLKVCQTGFCQYINHFPLQQICFQQHSQAPKLSTTQHSSFDGLTKLLHEFAPSCKISPAKPVFSPVDFV